MPALAAPENTATSSASQLPALPAPSNGEGAAAGEQQEGMEVVEFPFNEDQQKAIEEQKKLQITAPGNSRAVSFVSGEEHSGNQAGNKRRGRPKKSQSLSQAPASQKKTIKEFFTPKQSKAPDSSSKRRRDYDSSDEEMEEVENKSLKLSSPNAEEIELYKKVARALHMEGILKPAIAVEINEEHKGLKKTLKQEEKYLKSIQKGKISPSKEEIAMMSQVFKTKRWRSKQRLEDLFRVNKGLSDKADTEAKAVDYVSPDTTFNSSLGSLPDAYQDVFATEDED